MRRQWLIAKWWGGLKCGRIGRHVSTVGLKLRLEAEVDQVVPAMRIAGCIVERQLSAGRTINKLQLQKLLYLVDAASAEIWAHKAFPEPIVALPLGPAVSDVTNAYKDATQGSNRITAPVGDTSVPIESGYTIDWVLDRFGTWSADRLIKYVKRDGNPWQETFDRLGPGPHSIIDREVSRRWFANLGLDPEPAAVSSEITLAAQAGDYTKLAELI